MSAGDLLLYAGAASVFLASALRFLSMGKQDQRLESYSMIFSMLTFFLLSGALLILFYSFVTSDMSYLYVWDNSSTNLDLLYKFSGVWAGANGSFLLWIWFMSLGLFAEVFFERRRDYLSRRYHSIFQVAVAGIIFLFMVVLLNMNVFEQTPSAILAQYPQGYGMNLPLQTPEMAIHPPIVFAGYACLLISFGAALAYLMTDEKDWVGISIPWTRMAWLLLTLGIGIGAIWAYYVIGWGGYWGWDPVETSSLIPWIIATAFLHTLMRNTKKEEYKILSPVLGMVSFASVIFATFATRAGGIWASSVHSFGASMTSGGDRLLYLLTHDGTIMSIFAIMLLLFVLAIYLSYLKYRASERAEEEPVQEKLSGYVSDKNNMLLTVALLILTAAVMLFILMKNTGTTQAANYDELNQKMSVFFVAVMVTMSVCLIWKFMGRERAFELGIALIAISVALAIISAATGSVNGLVAFGAPSYIAAICISIYKLVRSGWTRSIGTSLQKASPQIIHLGIAMILLAFVVSSNMQVYPSSGQNVNLSLGGQVSTGEYSIRLLDVTYGGPVSLGGTTHADMVVTAKFQVASNGQILQQNLVLTNLYHTTSEGLSKLKAEVYIYKSALDDLYLSFEGDNLTSVGVQPKVIPLMNVLWGGLALLAIGIVARTVTWKWEPETKEGGTPEKKEAVEKQIAPEPRKEGVDYEAEAEEALRRYKQKKGR